jgi:predicted Zn-dependent peptidase
MLNRTQAPPFHKIEELHIPSIPQEVLPNQIPFLYIPEESTEIIRLDWIFNHGMSDWENPETVFYAFQMIKEGGAGKTASEIASLLDYYGAQLVVDTGLNTSTVSLYCLGRFLSELVPFVQSLMLHPQYPEKELSILKNRRLQQWKVNQQKTTWLASKHFRNAIFGEKHPYGYLANEQSLLSSTREELIEYHQKAMQKPDAVLFCGHLHDSYRLLIEQYLGQGLAPNTLDLPEFPIAHPESKKIIEIPGSVQSTLRMGWHSIPRQDPDFIRLLVTNELFGGYFGSRLMQNIREDKGLTYGIYSSLVHFKHASLQIIGSDVNKENTTLVIEEILKEVNALQSATVTAEELEKVKNYMAGSIAMQFSNAFSLAEYIKRAFLEGYDMNYYRDLPKNIHAVSREEIQSTAQRYFTTDKMTLVIAGAES